MQNWLSWRDWGRLLEERLQAEHTALARDTGWQAVGRWRWQSELKPRTQTSRVSLGGTLGSDSTAGEQALENGQRVRFSRRDGQFSQLPIECSFAEWVCKKIAELTIGVSMRYHT